MKMNAVAIGGCSAFLCRRAEGGFGFGKIMLTTQTRRQMNVRRLSDVEQQKAQALRD